jgi:hypothetical protein
MKKLLLLSVVIAVVVIGLSAFTGRTDHVVKRNETSETIATDADIDVHFIFEYKYF